MKWIRTIQNWVMDLILLLIFSLLAYALMLAPNGLPLYFRVLRLRDVQEKNLANILAEQRVIQNNKHLLEKDSEYFDKEARMVWGYVKPSETLYWYVDMEDEDGTVEHE